MEDYSKNLAGFRSKFNHIIDPKFRLSIPSRYRKVLRNYYHSYDVFLTTDDMEKLIVYPLAVWVKLENDWKKFAPYDESVEEHIYVSSYYGKELNLDGAGRVLIPQIYRNEMELGASEEVTIIGKIDYFEIWNQKRADEHMKKILARKNSKERLAEIGKKVRNLV